MEIVAVVYMVAMIWQLVKLELWLKAICRNQVEIGKLLSKAHNIPIKEK